MGFSGKNIEVGCHFLWGQDNFSEFTDREIIAQEVLKRNFSKDRQVENPKFWNQPHQTTKLILFYQIIQTFQNTQQLRLKAHTWTHASWPSNLSIAVQVTVFQNL